MVSTDTGAPLAPRSVTTTLAPPLAARVTRLAGALRDHDADPFAASLAERLDALLGAPDARVAARALVDAADLVGLERLRPAQEARDILAELVRTAHDLPAPSAARRPSVAPVEAPRGRPTALGALWRAWIARVLATARR